MKEFVLGVLLKILILTGILDLLMRNEEFSEGFEEGLQEEL